MAKRMLDIVGAVFGLAVLWPLIGLLAVGVRITSPGPAFLRQIRIGKGGLPFTLYKLRTMKSGTPNLPTHQVTDVALTPIGGFLRRWKFDELPQLVNVLVGHMSLVGPRPCLSSQRELIDARTREGVFKVRPGMTGLAQVQNIDMSDPMVLAKIDGEYVRTQSLAGDFKLILQTLPGFRVNADHVATRQHSEVRKDNNHVSGEMS